MSNRYKTIIIGAGASGLMCASLLDDKDDLLIVDSNPDIGAKIAISGGGRCNITNQSISADNYLGDNEFVSTILERWDQDSVIEWFTSRRLEVRLEKRGGYFCSHSAKDILKIFTNELSNVKIANNCKVIKVEKSGGIFLLRTECRDIECRNLVVASGGLSFPKLGASGIAFEIAEGFGHRVTDLSPALVGLTLQPEQFFFKDLSGISIPVKIKVRDKVFEDDMLFAHKGISGPAVLNGSLYWQKGSIEIDFLPNFDLDSVVGRKRLSSLLPLPKRVIRAFLEHLDIDDKEANKLNKSDIEKLKQMQKYSFAPAGTFGYSKAEVTRGGVDTTEIDRYTMMSLKEDSLYWLGEAIDVTGELGGYNLQWAFSTAAVCAEFINIKD